MKTQSPPLFLLISILLVGVFTHCSRPTNTSPTQPLHPTMEERFLLKIVDPQKENLQLYWKDEQGETFETFDKLKLFIESKQDTLLFAMNAGMFKKDFSPVGLYIESGRTITPLNSSDGEGNFYLKPNGVFYLTSDHTPVICSTPNFVNNGHIKYATQSGPMLVINGQIHPQFKQGSTNLNIRNGVGILPNNRVIFMMSKVEVNLYEFASVFKDLGCKNALYLDGYVSRTYFPEKNWIQMDGHFGVMIGVTKK